METEDQSQQADNIHLELEIPLNLLQYLNSEGCDVQNICRLCLSASNEAQLLLPTSQFCVTEEIFQAMTSVQISSNDDLPKRICSICQLELDHYFKFRSQCEKSDFLLRSLLKAGVSNKNEDHFDAGGVTAVEQDMKIIEIAIKSEEAKKHSQSNEFEEALKQISQEGGIAENVYNCYPDPNNYHEELKSILSEDEALCIVQDTLKNEKRYPKGGTMTRKPGSDDTIPEKSVSSLKKFTIYERGSEGLTEMIFPNSQDKTETTKPFKCMFCPQDFHHVKQLRTHESQHIEEHTTTTPKPNNPYPCKQCKETFHTDFDLNLHNIIHENGPWKCIICSKDFNEKSAIRRHIQRHMDSKRYACDVCGKTFVEFYALKRHARVHTGERLQKKYPCTECEKRFTDAHQLMVHMTHHSGERPFQCVVCGKAFSSARLLRSHRLVHSDLKKYACEYCDKRFRHETTRNTHHRTHTGEKPYVCSICGKSFIQASNLRLHMRTHTGEKPYTCSQCDSRFSSGSTLKAHVRTHTGERPYKCKVCGKSFARVNMKLHMRLHSGEKPFACSACPKRYVSAAHLRSHCRAHTGEKPFECAKCQSKFATKTLLIKHLQSKKKLNSAKPSIKLEQLENSLDISKNVNEFLTVPVQQIDNDIPNAIVELTLGTHETLDVSSELVFQENNVKTHVIVLGSSNTVSFVSNDQTGERGLNIVTVNEIGVSMSSTNTNS